MVFLLLGGRQGPEDVAPSSSKDAAKVRTIPDMAKRNFTLPKLQAENQRQKPHGLPHCHEKGPSIPTMIGGQCRPKGPFFSHGHAQCGTITKKAYATGVGSPILVVFDSLFYGRGFVVFSQMIVALSPDSMPPK